MHNNFIYMFRAVLYFFLAANYLVAKASPEDERDEVIVGPSRGRSEDEPLRVRSSEEGNGNSSGLRRRSRSFASTLQSEPAWPGRRAYSCGATTSRSRSDNKEDVRTRQCSERTPSKSEWQQSTNEVEELDFPRGEDKINDEEAADHDEETELGGLYALRDELQQAKNHEQHGLRDGDASPGNSNSGFGNYHSEKHDKLMGVYPSKQLVYDPNSGSTRAPASGDTTVEFESHEEEQHKDWDPLGLTTKPEETPTRNEHNESGRHQCTTKGSSRKMPTKVDNDEKCARNNDYHAVSTTSSENFCAPGSSRSTTSTPPKLQVVSTKSSQRSYRSTTTPVPIATTIDTPIISYTSPFVDDQHLKTRSTFVLPLDACDNKLLKQSPSSGSLTIETPSTSSGTSTQEFDEDEDSINNGDDTRINNGDDTINNHANDALVPGMINMGNNKNADQLLGSHVFLHEDLASTHQVEDAEKNKTRQLENLYPAFCGDDGAFRFCPPCGVVQRREEMNIASSSTPVVEDRGEVLQPCAEDRVVVQPIVIESEEHQKDPQEVQEDVITVVQTIAAQKEEEQSLSTKKVEKRDLKLQNIEPAKKLLRKAKIIADRNKVKKARGERGEERLLDTRSEWGPMKALTQNDLSLENLTEELERMRNLRVYKEDIYRDNRGEKAWRDFEILKKKWMPSYDEWVSADIQEWVVKTLSILFFWTPVRDMQYWLDANLGIVEIRHIIETPIKKPEQAVPPVFNYEQSLPGEMDFSCKPCGESDDSAFVMPSPIAPRKKTRKPGKFFMAKNYAGKKMDDSETKREVKTSFRLHIKEIDLPKFNHERQWKSLFTVFYVAFAVVFGYVCMCVFSVSSNRNGLSPKWRHCIFYGFCAGALLGRALLRELPGLFATFAINWNLKPPSWKPFEGVLTDMHTSVALDFVEDYYLYAENVEYVAGFAVVAFLFVIYFDRTLNKHEHGDDHEHVHNDHHHDEQNKNQPAAQVVVPEQTDRRSVDMVYPVNMVDDHDSTPYLNISDLSIGAIDDVSDEDASTQRSMITPRVVASQDVDEEQPLLLHHDNDNKMINNKMKERTNKQVQKSSGVLLFLCSAVFFTHTFLEGVGLGRMMNLEAFSIRSLNILLWHGTTIMAFCAMALTATKDFAKGRARLVFAALFIFALGLPLGALYGYANVEATTMLDAIFEDSGSVFRPIVLLRFTMMAMFLMLGTVTLAHDALDHDSFRKRHSIFFCIVFGFLITLCISHLDVYSFGPIIPRVSEAQYAADVGSSEQEDASFAQEFSYVMTNVLEWTKRQIFIKAKIGEWIPVPTVSNSVRKSCACC